MFTKILIILVAVFAVTFVTAQTAHAAETCYGAGSTSREDATSSIAWRFQTFTAGSSPYTAVTLNMYGTAAETHNWHLSFVETVGGVPDGGSPVAGSTVQIPVSQTPDLPVGFSQEFVCSESDEAKMLSQTFTFAAPVALTPGVVYAIQIHETGTFGTGTIGYNTGIPAAIPGEGYFCTSITQPCSGLAGLNQFPGGSGINYDYMYILHDEIVDVNTNDGKIDGQIQQLREYLQLDGTDGGLMFGLIVMSVVFAIGLVSKIPFLIVAMLNLLLVGIFSRAEIMPPWVVLAVVAVAGIAVIFRLIGGGSRGQNEV